SAELTGQIASLNALLAQVRREREGSQTRLTSLPPSRTPEPWPGGARDTSAAPADGATPRQLSGLGLGRYYALVIGNQNYRRIESLATPIADAHRAARALREGDGFTVTVVDDAEDGAVLRALNRRNARAK